MPVVCLVEQRPPWVPKSPLSDTTFLLNVWRIGLISCTSSGNIIPACRLLSRGDVYVEETHLGHLGVNVLHHYSHVTECEVHSNEIGSKVQ